MLITLFTSCDPDACKCVDLDKKWKMIGAKELSSDELDYLLRCERKFSSPENSSDNAYSRCAEQ